MKILSTIGCYIKVDSDKKIGPMCGPLVNMCRTLKKCITITPIGCCDGYMLTGEGSPLGVGFDEGEEFCLDGYLYTATMETLACLFCACPADSGYSNTPPPRCVSTLFDVVGSLEGTGGTAHTLDGVEGTLFTGADLLALSGSTWDGSTSTSEPLPDGSASAYICEYSVGLKGECGHAAWSGAGGGGTGGTLTGTTFTSPHNSKPDAVWMDNSTLGTNLDPSGTRSVCKKRENLPLSLWLKAGSAFTINAVVCEILEETPEIGPCGGILYTPDDGTPPPALVCKDTTTIPDRVGSWYEAVFGGVAYPYNGPDALTFLQNIVADAGGDPSAVTLESSPFGGQVFTYCPDSEGADGFTEFIFDAPPLNVCNACQGTVGYNYLGMNTSSIRTTVGSLLRDLRFGNFNAGNANLVSGSYSVNGGALLPLTLSFNPSDAGRVMTVDAAGGFVAGINLVYGTVTDANGLTAEVQYEIELSATGAVIGHAWVGHKGINGGGNPTGQTGTDADCVGDGINELALIVNVNPSANNPNGSSTMVSGAYYHGDELNGSYPSFPVSLSEGVIGFQNRAIQNESVASCTYALGADVELSSGNTIFVHSTVVTTCDGVACDAIRKTVTVKRECS